MPRHSHVFKSGLFSIISDPSQTKAVFFVTRT